MCNFLPAYKGSTEDVQAESPSQNIAWQWHQEEDSSIWTVCHGLFALPKSKQTMTESAHGITKTYNFVPFKPYFYTVKLGFTGVYIIFLFMLKNIDCGYSFEPPRRGGSNEYPQSLF